MLNLCLEVKKLPFLCCIYFLVTVTINVYKHLTVITDLILLGKLLLDGSVCTHADFTQLCCIYLAIRTVLEDFEEICFLLLVCIQFSGNSPENHKPHAPHFNIMAHFMPIECFLLIRLAPVNCFVFPLLSNIGTRIISKMRHNYYAHSGIVLDKGVETVYEYIQHCC